MYFEDNVNNVPDYEKLFPEMKRNWNCTDFLETKEQCLVIHEKASRSM